MSPRLSHVERRVHELEALCHKLIAWRAVLEDRMDKTVRHGKVTDVDTKKQLARIEIGNKDGVSLKSPWVPYAQVAGPDGQGSGQGEYKFHNPPTVGQQMTLFSPNGEFRQAAILPFTWYDKAVSPSQANDEHVVTYGKLKITHKKDRYDILLDQSEIEIKAAQITAKVSGSSIEITPGEIKIKSAKVSIIKG
jgi:phage baseplate assembly protein gpV